MHNGAFKSKESWLKSKYPSRSWELHDKLLMLRKKRPTRVCGRRMFKETCRIISGQDAACEGQVVGSKGYATPVG